MVKVSQWRNSSDAGMNTLVFTPVGCEDNYSVNINYSRWWWEITIVSELSLRYDCGCERLFVVCLHQRFATCGSCVVFVAVDATSTTGVFYSAPVCWWLWWLLYSTGSALPKVSVCVIIHSSCHWTGLLLLPLQSQPLCSVNAFSRSRFSSLSGLSLIRLSGIPDTSLSFVKESVTPPNSLTSLPQLSVCTDSLLLLPTSTCLCWQFCVRGKTYWM